MKESHAGSRARAVLGGKKSKSKGGKHPHSIHIHRGHSGGFSVQHHFENGPEEAPEPDQTHIVPDVPSLQDHIAQNMGDQPPAPMAPQPDAAQGGGAPAGPAPQPGM